jgi:hypothetical protein
MVITRWAEEIVLYQLESFPAVALLGPRQIGKTTLALDLESAGIITTYLDLERPSDAAKLTDADAYLRSKSGERVVIDEVQRNAELFPILRGVIDEQRRTGTGHGAFLLLGSASLELVGAASESLAGRLAYVDLTSITPAEAKSASISQEQTWLRGGFPNSLLANSDRQSLQWRESFMRSFLDRDIPMFAPRLPVETLSRLWQMVAHNSGGILNAATLTTSLGVSGPTVSRYLDLLVDLGMLRFLRPWTANVAKRVVKRPKVFVRDTGILHALLAIETMEELRGHPVIGHSFESLVVESLSTALATNARGTSWEVFYYRTHQGSEMDLVLVKGGIPKIAVAIKNSTSPKLTQGFHNARQDLGVDQSYVVYSGTERYKIAPNIDVISLVELQNILHAM